MFCDVYEELFCRAQMAVKEIPYKVTIAIFSYMELSISRSEKRGNLFPLESQLGPQYVYVHVVV